MQACSSVEKEIQKIASKMQLFEQHSSSTLQELIDSVSSMEQELLPDDPSDIKQAHAMVLETYIKKIKDVTSSLSTQHRDLHTSVSKVGKIIEKNFTTDITTISKQGVFDDKDKQYLLNRVICEHFLRRDYIDVGRTLMAEANVEIPTSFEESFSELNSILLSLKDRNLEPALAWVERHIEKLDANESLLKLKLHRLKFIRLLRDGATNRELCEYARQHFQQLARTHEEEIQTLMGCLLYTNKEALLQSRYAYLLREDIWDEICQVFATDACAALGYAVESPLEVSVRAGCVAVSYLLNIKQVMEQRQVSVWCNDDDLPIEIHLDSKHQFHSVFACPILRQQSSEQNPPMRLLCGHVISQDALHKLASATKVKCPYCPAEQSPTEVRKLFF